ncbi:MAG: hypothetical protein M1835_000590 [Candelina submexicana]|nr:MAG: hypothetical protein M1835_000590 [Candelina submexicana]
MDEDDPRLIVTLEAINPTAERAWNRSENRDRCSYSSESVGGVPRNYPAPGRRGSQIQLTLDKKPTNVEKGFVFGSDPQTCDVLLGDWGAGFSRQHFRITFNAQGQVILEDTSRVITCVNYKGEDSLCRNHFTWILFDRYKNIEVTLNKWEKIELKFKVQWPERSKSSPTEYKAHREAYIDERRNALPPLSQLGVESQQTTALLTAQHSPRQQPIYLTEEELGCGAFGTVYKAINVSTGNKYAAKEFHSGNWKKEVEILKSVSHEHIVTFVDFSEEQKPLLVMEYLPLGNLEAHRKRRKLLHRSVISEKEFAFIIVHLHHRSTGTFKNLRRSGTLQTEDKAASTLSKRRWPHATQSPTADAVGRGQSKRSRASIPCEAGKQLSKAPNPRQGPEQLERSISSDYEGPLATEVASLTQDTEPIPRVAPKPVRKRTRLDWGRSSSPVTEVGLNEIEKPPPKCNDQDPMRALLEGSPDGEDEGKAKVTDFDARHVQIKIKDNIVLMRIEDCSLNATQILMLTNKTSGESEHLLQLMKQSIKMEVLPPIAGFTFPCSWVSFEHGQIICKHFRLEQELQPLIDHGLKLQYGNCSKPLNYINNDPMTISSQFFVINVLPHPVTVRKSDLRIKVSDIFRASGLPQNELPKIKREFRESYIKVGHLNYRGTYVDFWVGVVLCRRYGLTKLEKELCTWKNALLEPVKKPERPEAELSDFIEITGFSGPVMVRRVDFRINASHIIKLAGRPRTTLANFRKSLRSEAYDILRGSQKRQGTYVDFDVGIELCQKYGLSQLEKRLYSLKRTSEGPVLLESLGSERASPREKSTPSTPTSVKESDTDGSMQVEDAHETDSGSGGSFKSSKPCSIQQKSQPVPSDRGAQDAVSSQQPEYGTGHSSLELLSSHSPSAKNVQYEVWDSRSQLSELTEIKPHLRSSPWQTASDYGSFNELFAPI